MPRHDSTFGVSEVARLFSVDRNLVKTWAYHFSDYLDPQAKPAKGTPHRFLAEDLRVLAYIFMYWEDQPDFESIRIGLNTDSHFEKPYDDLLASVTPLFQEPPDELDESWRHGTLIGGMAEIGDFFDLAESYKLAGDMLVDSALSNDEAFELVYPVVYNYRHATELYLKSIVAPARDESRKINHNLVSLLERFKKLVKGEFNATVPEWLENMILILNDADPDSTTFRYGDGSFLARGEVWVDLVHVKTQMGWLAESFQRIKHRRDAI